MVKILLFPLQTNPTSISVTNFRKLITKDTWQHDKVIWKLIFLVLEENMSSQVQKDITGMATVR